MIKFSINTVVQEKENKKINKKAVLFAFRRHHSKFQKFKNHTMNKESKRVLNPKLRFSFKRGQRIYYQCSDFQGINH